MVKLLIFTFSCPVSIEIAIIVQQIKEKMVDHHDLLLHVDILLQALLTSIFSFDILCPELTQFLICQVENITQFSIGKLLGHQLQHFLSNQSTMSCACNSLLAANLEY